ncbi:MAG: cyclic nucleotide-binding domain-containing protein [Chloroflexi bacterium]|nr:cyclic nucleotide-binding domain-containing protein [Chloroflexota bacterium]
MADSAASVDAAPPQPEGVWARLAERLNPAFEQPTLRPGIIARHLTTARGRAYYICKNPAAGTYLRLAPDEYFLLGLMDGTHQVKDLVLAYFLEYRRFAFQRVAHLVTELRRHRFLTEEPVDVWGELRRYFVQRSLGYRVDHLISSFRYREFPLHGIDPVIAALYRRGGWLFFTPPLVVLWALLAVVGVVVFVWQLTGGGRDPLHIGGSYALGVFALLALYLGTVSIHELGHALATKHFGREVPRGGMMLYYGMPAFFMDTTDIWMEPRRARLIVSAAGMWAVWGLGGLAMLGLLIDAHGPLAQLLFQLAFVAFINNSLNLLPLLELDGYFLLVDWLELPLLRARALAFVRQDLWRKLRQREPFDREERIFAIFGLLALVYSALAVAAALYFWSHKLAHLVRDALTSESAGLRGLVAVVLVAFGVPFAFGLGVKLYQLVGAARGGVGWLRHQREEARARLRYDARALVGALRFLGRLTFAEREALVSALTLERYRAGDYVVRQGTRGRKFYLVRDGQAEVVQAGGPDGPHELARLRRGDTFGELALLYDQPRSASVRALTRLEVLALDGPTFATLIAPRLREHGFTRERLEARSELGRMSLFRYCTSSELDPILDRLRAEEYASGAAIVRQGESGDRFYLLRRGRVGVYVATAAGEQPLGALGPGEYFGEMALLHERPRSATVRALVPTAVWSLSKADFQALIDQFHLREALSDEVARRAELQRRATGQPAG